MNKKFLFPFYVIAVLGYFFCGFALQNDVAVPAFLYWAFFLSIPALALSLISDNENVNVIILVITSFSVYSMFFLQNTAWYAASRDTQYELQVISSIYETGVWTPGMGTGFSSGMSYTPTMHIFLSSLCSVTGIQPFQSIFLLPWIKAVALCLFVYLFAREFLSSPKLAFFSTLICLCAVWHIAFPHRQIFAEVLFIAALWVFIKKNRNPKISVVYILFMTALVMCHNFVSYILILVVVSTFIFDRKRIQAINPLLSVTFLLSWSLFVATASTSWYMISVFESLDSVFTLKLPSGPTLAAASFFYTPLENLIVFLNPILLGLIALPLFFKQIKSRKNPNLTTITFILGLLVLTALPLYLFTTDMGTSFLRIWGFFYIPLSVLVTYAIGKRFFNGRKLTKIVVTIFILMLFTSMNLSSMESGIKKWYMPRESMEAYVYSDSMINTAYWCSDYLNGSILGDHFAFDIIGSWGYYEIDSEPFFIWYETHDDSLVMGYDYIIVSPWIKVTVLDTYREPIDPFPMLDESFNVVYDSGDFLIYNNPYSGIN